MEREREKGKRKNNLYCSCEMMHIAFLLLQHFFPSSYSSSECDTIKHQSKEHSGGLGGICYAKWDPWTLHCMHLVSFMIANPLQNELLSSQNLAIINSTISHYMNFHNCIQYLRVRSGSINPSVKSLLLTPAMSTLCILPTGILHWYQELQYYLP